MKKIESIASIRFGISGSAKKHGEVPLVLGRSITENGEYVSNQNAFASGDEITKSDYLKESDILFLAKGSFSRPYVINENDLPLVASSVFFIIRADQTQVLPEYLAWFLQTPRFRHYVKVLSEGSTITSVSIREFRKLEVPVPDIGTQKKIIRLQVLQKSYKKHVDLLGSKIELLTNEISNQLTEKK